MLWHARVDDRVRARVEYLIPVTPDLGPDGLGRARTFTWPASAVEITRDEAATAEVDVVVPQRPGRAAGAGRRLARGAAAGADLPAVYLEHNAPRGGSTSCGMSPPTGTTWWWCT